jgi:hypothetical protein
MPVLRGIVKDDPERMSVSLAKFANSMAKGHTIVATVFPVSTYGADLRL